MNPMELVGRLANGATDAHASERSAHKSAALLTEAAACIRELVEWRPIETAPRDRTEIIGLCGRKDVRLIWYFAPSSRTMGWCDQNGKFVKPTHWLPLPPAPGAEA